LKKLKVQDIYTLFDAEQEIESNLSKPKDVRKQLKSTLKYDGKRKW